jgi:hypothetical protein
VWVYRQTSGKVMTPEGATLATGYSGAGAGKNQHAYETVENVGPIPCGRYVMQPPINSDEHGPFAIPLTPDISTEMFGRHDFMIHGDSIPHSGFASEGCVILGRLARQEMWNSSDHLLEVVV